MFDDKSLNAYLNQFDDPEDARRQIIALQISAEEGNLAKDFASHPFYKILDNYFKVNIEAIQNEIENEKKDHKLIDFKILVRMLKFYKEFELYLKSIIEEGETSKDRLKQVQNDM